MKANPSGFGTEPMAVGLPAGCGSLAQTSSEALSIERNRQLMRRYFEEVWNEGRLDVLDEIMAPDYLNHSSSIADPKPGPVDLKPIVEAMREGIPDLRYEILDMVITPEKAAVFLRVTGTHSGNFFGIAPTGKKIDVRQMQIEWIREGKISQHWRVTDELTLLRQVGELE